MDNDQIDYAEDYEEEEIDQRYITFFWGPMGRFNLSPSEALLLALIDSFCKKNEYCYASKEYLAKVLNITRATVHTHLDTLEELGLIEYGDMDKAHLIKSTEKYRAYLRVIRGRYTNQNKEELGYS